MIFASVRTGLKYGYEYVEKLRAGIYRHYPKSYSLVNFTDDSKFIKEHQLDGWWGKLALFERTWRRDRKVIYLDLDVVCVGDLMALASVECDFAICDNFARLSGRNWPCKYNSSIMILGPNLDDRIWQEFIANKDGFMKVNRKYGDQKVIEELYPDATILQDVLPKNYLIGYREMYKDYFHEKPENTAIVVFAGSHKPDRPDIAHWVRKEWNGLDV